MDRRAALGAIAATLTTGVVGCVSVPGIASIDHDIGMSATAFDPIVYETVVGESVIWYNSSSRAHTVTAYQSGIPAATAYFASGGFVSEADARAAWNDRRGGNFYSGESYRHVFEVPGTYHYFCIPHERGGMTGRIEVADG